MSAFRGSLSRIYRGLTIVGVSYNEFKSRIWEWIVSRFYALLPTEEGVIDEELEEDIQKGLLKFGARFKTFNRIVGSLTGIGLLSTILLLIGVLIFNAFPYPHSNILWTILFLIVTLGNIIVFGISILFIFAADILFVLFLGSLLKYGLQQMQANIARVGKSDMNRYECRRESERVTVYASNYSSYVRSIIYGIILLLIGSVWVLSPRALHGIEWVATQLPFDKVPREPVMTFADSAVSGINALLPINIVYFFSREGAKSLAVLVIILLGFSIFLHGKKISQHAELSRFEWSDIEPFSATEELRRCYLITKISLHHLLHGNLESESREIREEILMAGFTVVVATGLSTLYLYVVLNVL